jgi:hypothetical protein
LWVRRLTGLPPWLSCDMRGARLCEVGYRCRRQRACAACGRGLRGVVISAPVLRLLHPCCGSRCACGGRRDLGATSALAAAGAAAAGGRGLMRAARAGCRAGGAWQRAAQWRVGSCRGQR